jgi:hypothetical protein
MKAGRQELNYGDQLVVGGVGWHNTGRSFDAIKFNKTSSLGSTDLFLSKITQTSNSTSDADFYGFYHAFNFDLKWFKVIDIYSFYNSDRTAGSLTRVAAHGARLKSKVDRFDYRAEGTFQKTSRGDEKQYDLELGWTFSDKSKFRGSVEGFYASEGYAQLYPTAHKWLGIADFFSRRNIQGVRVGLSRKLAKKWSAKFDFHEFRRTSDQAGAYNFSGTSFGTTGTEKKIAKEYDFTATYAAEDNLKFAFGYAYVDTGKYLEANAGSDHGYFFFAQMLATF